MYRSAGLADEISLTEQKCSYSGCSNYASKFTRSVCYEHLNFIDSRRNQRQVHVQGRGHDPGQDRGQDPGWIGAKNSVLGLDHAQGKGYSGGQESNPNKNLGNLIHVSSTLIFTNNEEILVESSELSTGRMNPRVGSGWVGSRFCRILAGRVGSALRIYYLFTDYFLVPEST